MIKFHAKVTVKIKPDVEDKRSEILCQAIEYLMPVENLSCKAGDVYYLDFSAENQCQALHIVEKISMEILADEEREDYEIRKLEEFGSGS